MERDCESELSKLNIEQNACIYHFGASVIHGQRSNILRLLLLGYPQNTKENGRKEIMNFKELLYRARQGDEDAILEIFEMYRPLLIKNALVDGIFDEDLYQELTAELLKCIRYFRDVE